MYETKEKCRRSIIRLVQKTIKQFIHLEKMVDHKYQKVCLKKNKKRFFLRNIINVKKKTNLVFDNY
jgi:hypothetical protein